MPIIAKHPGCKPHEFQDKFYGEGFRLLNDSSPGVKNDPLYRCTVCCPPKVKNQHQGGEYALSQLKVKG